MKKEEYFTIGQAASACGVSTRTLRHYEQLGLIRPALTDSASQYRYYNLLDILHVNLISTLKDSGMLLKNVKKYLNGSLTAKEQLNILYEQKENLERSIATIKLYDTQKDILEPEVVQMPERLCFVKRITAADISDATNSILAVLDQYIRSYQCSIGKTQAFTEFPPEAFKDGKLFFHNFPINICIPVNEQNSPEDAVCYPACKAVAINYRGDYINIGIAYDALYSFMKKQNLLQSGNPQEFYIEGANNAALPPDQYITRIVIPVNSKDRF